MPHHKRSPLLRLHSLTASCSAWLITRTVARRVHGLADVAEVIAEGCLDITPAFDNSGDEVGRLSRAFDTMTL